MGLEFKLSSVTPALKYKLWKNLCHQPHVILDHFLNSDIGF